MNIKQRALHIIASLKECYPDAGCSLQSSNALQLLIATRLSAQCTDKRVNIVTQELFARYASATDFAKAEPADIEQIIRPCGLFKTKARDIVQMCQMLVSSYGSSVPDTIDELVKLPGVGRKTANLIVGDVYGKPAIVVDTHCIRLSNRMGLVDSKNPIVVEKALRSIIPPEESNLFCHRLVLHGREICKARNRDCGRCCVSDVCPKK